MRKKEQNDKKIKMENKAAERKEKKEKKENKEKKEKKAAERKENKEKKENKAAERKEKKEKKVNFYYIQNILNTVEKQLNNRRENINNDLYYIKKII